jgi:hypothetical protein
MYLVGNASLTTFNAPILDHSSGWLALSNCPLLTSFSAPLYNISIEYIVFDNCVSLATVNLPSMVVFGSDWPLAPSGISCSGCTSLTAVNFNAAILFDDHSMALFDNCALPDAQINTLADRFAASVLWFDGFGSNGINFMGPLNGIPTGLGVIDLATAKARGIPLLTNLDVDVIEYASDPLAAYSNSVVQTVATYVSFTACPNLTSVSIPNLISTGAITCSGCPVLTSIVLTSFVPADGSIFDFTANALTTATINAFLAVCVANAGYVSGSIDFSGGTNSAPIGAGIADLATLLGRGVTVTTNLHTVADITYFTDPIAYYDDLTIETVTNQVQFVTCSNLTHIGLGNLTTTGSIYIFDNAALGTVDFSVLTSSPGGISLTFSAITALSLPVFVPLNGSILNFDACVNLPVGDLDALIAMCVANAGFVTGSLILSNCNAITDTVGVDTLRARGVTVLTSWY